MKYKSWSEPASKLLKEAGNLVENVSLKKYLLSRADASLSNDYFQSDLDWLQIDNQSRIDVTMYLSLFSLFFCFLYFFATRI
jgi:hypothetical protein